LVARRQRGQKRLVASNSSKLSRRAIALILARVRAVRRPFVTATS
jgi:hypothetical protein